MHDSYQSKGGIAIFFFISFMVFNADILVNVFVAVIYENFEQSQTSKNEKDVLSL
jgi:hypothetical protein